MIQAYPHSNTVDRHENVATFVMLTLVLIAIGVFTII
jgi:hypothetical protein